MSLRRRALCYITRQASTGLELLVFRQDDPKAGIQTPGGTVEPGEDVAEGALREAFEESGLCRFGKPQQIYFEPFEGQLETVECHHVHLPVVGATLDAWTHIVSAGSEDAGMAFYCFWLKQRLWFGRIWFWGWISFLSTKKSLNSRSFAHWLVTVAPT